MTDTKASAFELIRRPALYVIATPIGHLGDLSLRALHILEHVDSIAAEDTRHSKQLLDHYGIRQRLFSVHDHNETAQIETVLASLHNGEAIGLISDAGTPLISDPGYKLVREVRAAGFPVIAIPGPCALIAALSIAGLPTDRFTFRGFLPAKSQARQTALHSVSTCTETLVYYESTHRILECLQDVELCLGDRALVLAKELTKPFESVQSGTSKDLIAWLQEDHRRQNGEFVLLIAGAKVKESEEHPELIPLLTALLKECPLKTAVKIASGYLGINKNDVYDCALTLK